MSTVAKQAKNYEDFVRNFVEEEEKESKFQLFKNQYFLSVVLSTIGCFLVILANYTQVFPENVAQIISVAGTVMTLFILFLFWHLYSLTFISGVNSNYSDVQSESTV